MYLREHYPKYNILFIFGGGTMGFSRDLKVLRKFDVKGLVSVGEGELKLESIVNLCLNNDSLCVDDIMSMCGNSIEGVYCISKLTEDDMFNIKALRGMQLKTIEDLPLPDYTEYFAVLKEYCQDDDVFLDIKNKVVIYLEGSRGCYWGKCAFCGLNSSWCGYRHKSPRKIHEDFISALKKYKVFSVQFTDNICDPWASGFADLMIKNGVIGTQMVFELKASNKEAFYTKLAVAGSRFVQIGIESLSDNLLKKMNKGTHVIDNVQTMKYLKELGVFNGSNLLIRFPGSTLAEIKQTKEMLFLVSHFGRMTLSTFELQENSPIYNKLGLSKRKGLKTFNEIKMPNYLYAYFLGYYLLPKTDLFSSKVEKAWNDFKKWYENWDAKDASLYVNKISDDTILIKDGRFDKVKEYIYSGCEQRIYTLCHRASTIEELVKETGIGLKGIKDTLKRFIKAKLMITANDKYLSLAVRPKQELINNYYKGQTI